MQLLSGEKMKVNLHLGGLKGAGYFPASVFPRGIRFKIKVPAEVRL